MEYFLVVHYEISSLVKTSVKVEQYVEEEAHINNCLYVIRDCDFETNLER